MAKGAPPPFAKKGKGKPNPFAGKKAPPFGGGGKGAAPAADAPPFFKRGGKVK